MAAPSSLNKKLAELFHQMFDCYRYLGKKEQFRAIAYDNAARTIDGLKDDISTYATDVATLDALHGIGESIAMKIIEYIKTGQVKTFERLKKRVPVELLALMDISGLGPSTVKTLHSKLRINSKADLIKALEGDAILKLRGFGEKKVDNIRKGLKLYKERQKRLLLYDALQIGNALLVQVKKIDGVKMADLAGSLRRKKETIGDIDIIACAESRKRKDIIEQILKLPGIARVLARGDTKVSLLLKQSNVQVDVRLVKESEYGAALLYFTGSKEHSVALRTLVKDKKWKLNEYGLFDEKGKNLLPGATEEELYNKLGFAYIPPELRENRGELEKAMHGYKWHLVDIKDIKGDMQMHSTWSDGSDTIEAIARHVLKAFPQYEYIVITDHSPSERVAKGLTIDEFKKQFLEIAVVNKKLGKDFVKKGVEVDILNDGSLDLPDSLLKQFDWVTASVHTAFNKDNTDRLLKACRHPYVHCISHPGGRLIGKREPYPVNWKLLFSEAAKTGTALEVNAQPDRLDLPDDLIKQAVEQGVRIVISTDAHALKQYDFIVLGVDTARRGWCAKKDILNTGDWQAIEKFKQKKAALLSLVPI